MAAALLGVETHRTAAMLACELEVGMGDKDTPRNVRIPDELWARVEALAERMSADSKAAAIAGGTVSRAAALRLAVVEGVEVLEQRYPKPKRGRK